ncbi:MAG: metal ABC transporter permease [Ilumatobacteraceae bacterium]
MDWLLDPFQSPFSQRGAIAALVVGVLSPVVGTWVSLRRLSYMGDAMSHSVLGGVGLGYLWFGSVAVLPGALAAGVVMALAIHWLSQNRRVSHDSVIAVVGSGMFALGVLVISSVGSTVSLSHYLFGQLLTVSRGDLWITFGLAVAGVAFVWWHFDDLKLSTFDRDHATQIGIAVQRLDASMLVLLAVSVVVSLNTVGVALTVSLLITPAATARLFFDKVSTITTGAIGIGMASILGGFIASYHADLPPGPTITIVATSVFVVAYVSRIGRDEGTYVRHRHRHHHDHQH